jgi:hypothetical protein
MENEISSEGAVRLLHLRLLTILSSITLFVVANWLNFQARNLTLGRVRYELVGKQKQADDNHDTYKIT